MMEVWGGKVHPSPSSVTEFGRSLLAQDPDHPGSLGIAISEAVSQAVEDPEVRYALGSVLNHVLLHQTIIGEEALLQLAKVDAVPDVLVGCRVAARTSVVWRFHSCGKTGGTHESDHTVC